MKVWRGLLAVALLLCTLLCVASITAAADTGTHTNHPICGATHKDIGDHKGTCNAVTWTAWDGKSNITYDSNNTAYVYLTGNVEWTSVFTLEGKTLYLCLNGYSITRTTDSDQRNIFDAVIHIHEKAQLVLCDCKGSGKITHATDKGGRGIRIGTSSSGGTFTMFGGEISGNRVTNKVGDGAGVEMQQSTFTMYGGKITDNHVINGSNNEGGGVSVHTSSTFTMYGGEISNNTSAGDGGGVMSVGSNTNLYGGTISNNTAKERGGGVWTNMPLTMTDNVNITDNTAESGGGIFIYDESVTINGGNIIGNTATYGGGVYVVSDYRIETLTISGSVTISENTATEAGGGIYAESGKNTSNWNKGQASLIVSGGNIIKNTATGKGGGIYVGERSYLTIKGGNVTENTAIGNGGGVYYNGESNQFNISGNVNVAENKKNGIANNIYLPSGQIIKITSTLTNTTPIGVTTEVEPSNSAYVQIASGNKRYATSDNFQYENSNTEITAITRGNTTSLVVCSHNWGTEWKTDSTNHWRECSICKAKGSESAHFGGIATCEDKAPCEVCGMPYGYSLGHDFGGAWQKSANTHWKKCSRCNATTTEVEHDWDGGEEIIRRTCTADGVILYTCNTCSATKTGFDTAMGHSFSQTPAKAPTCTERGWNDYYTCTDCGYTTYVEIPAYNHDFGGTWQTDGSYHWKTCSRCNVAVDDKADHTWGDAEDTITATCTATGLKTYTCTVCKAIKRETVSAQGHDLVHHDAQKATCENVGWYAYEDCKNCSYSTYVEIPAPGHDFPSGVWTKDENNHWIKCSRCGETEAGSTATHDWDEGKVTTAPTCTATGIKLYTCEDCHATKTESVPATGHNIAKHTAKAATCDDFGWEAYEDCANNCGYTTYVELPSLSHDFTSDTWQHDGGNHWKKCSHCDETSQTGTHVYVEKTILDPTCTATGLKLKICTVCNKSETETIPATGHSFAKHVAKAPTCENIGWEAYEDCANNCGYTTYIELPSLGHYYPDDVLAKDETYHWEKCSRCGFDSDSTKHAHEWDEGKITTAPTCTATGVKTFTCDKCHATKTETIAKDPHNFGDTWKTDEKQHWKECTNANCNAIDQQADHTWNEGKVTTEPSCTATGVRTFTCNDCGATKTETIAKIAHPTTHYAAKDPTCTENGWKAYDKCTVCNYTTYVEIPALDHDYTGDTWLHEGDEHWKKCSRCDETNYREKHVWDEGDITLKPTCTATGIKLYTCQKCFVTKTETLNATGHTYEDHDAKDPTCLDIGWKAYKECSECHHSTRAEIAALGHDFTTDAWQCDDDNHWKKCSRCDEIDQKTEHSWNDGEITLQPTCLATGRKTYTCTVCLKTKTETVDALGHDLASHVAQAATCLGIGWDAYVTCSRCDYTTYKEIPSLGHDEIPHEAKAATCMAIGWDAYVTCSRCDYTTYKENSVLGHDFPTDTWQNDSDNHWKKCTRCDAIAEKAEHTWNNGEITTAPTCTTAGLKTYTCTVCHATKEETMNALGHDEISHEGKDATCAGDGWKPYVTCSRCDYTTYEKIDALNHNFIRHSAKAATCTESGWNTYVTCSRCGYTNYKKIDALGHDFTGGTWQSDTDQHWKQCSRCEAVGEMAQHVGGTATCKDSAVCATCAQTYGTPNPDNHVGDTEIRNMAKATAEKTGYTGDVYCKGCNAKLYDGTIIPALSNLTTGKKDDLTSAVKNMEKVLGDLDGTYTGEQKKLLVDSINAAKSTLESIEKAEDTIKKVKAMPSADTVKPDNTAAINAYEAAKSAYEALSDDEKRMAGDSTKAALDTMQKALTAYDVTSGNGSTWAENGNDGLTFTANGYHKKFAGITINGAVVDKSHYDVKEGSTIITLKAEFLQSLPAGEYTLLIQYTDGSTDGKDTFTIARNVPDTPSEPTDPTAPQTESHSMLVVWIIIAIICIGIFILLLLFFKKRKKQDEKEKKQ